jgi:uncharacterized Ntn-hydrolase superfamily protein
MTFSITARCPETGQFGIAVSTKLMCVGALCPFVSDFGAVATQSFVNPYLGINGLTYLSQGLSAQEVADRLTAEDEGRALRQFAVVDQAGRSAAFSGGECIQWYGHRTGDGYAVAGNMLVGEETIASMARSFESSEGNPLAERLVQALEAGQSAGGDKRGRQSAALKVHATEAYPMVDLRIDDHPDPVAELRRLYNLYLEELAPVLSMLPTREHPAGLFDLDAIREHLPDDG